MEYPVGQMVVFQHPTLGPVYARVLQAVKMQGWTMYTLEVDEEMGRMYCSANELEPLRDLSQPKLAPGTRVRVDHWKYPEEHEWDWLLISAHPEGVVVAFIDPVPGYRIKFDTGICPERCPRGYTYGYAMEEELVAVPQ